MDQSACQEGQLLEQKQQQLSSGCAEWQQTDGFRSTDQRRTVAEEKMDGCRLK